MRAGLTQVIHITQHLEIGGLESLVVDLCRSLDSGTFSSHVLCLNGYDERYRSRLEADGTKVHLITKRHVRDYLFLLRAARLVRDLQADIIHVHSGCFLYGALIGRLAGTGRLFYTAHGMPLNTGLKARTEELLACAMTDHIIAVSDQIAADLRSRNLFASKKITVIINGVDTARYAPYDGEYKRTIGRKQYGLPLDRKIIGSVGRLETIKNYSLLLQACALLFHGGCPDFQLVLAGNGSLEEELKQEAKELGIAEQVTFLGMQYNLEKLYPLFDLFALSSLTEGTSLALLEAQSCGLPAVATDVGGNSRIIHHGLNGLLCPSGNKIALADCLERLLRNEQQRFVMGKQARTQILQRFSLNRMAAAYRELYLMPLEQGVTSYGNRPA